MGGSENVAPASPFIPNSTGPPRRAANVNVQATSSITETKL